LKSITHIRPGAAKALRDSEYLLLLEAIATSASTYVLSRDAMSAHSAFTNLVCALTNLNKDINYDTND